MNQTDNRSRIQLEDIEALIAALKREREGLERRYALLRKHRDFLDEASRLYFELWRLKIESGLEILELSPDQKQLLENMISADVLEQQLQVIEGELHRLVSEGRCLTFAEIEGALQILDGIIERLEKQRRQIAMRRRSALQTLKALASKTIRVCGGVGLIGVDLPVQNWPSVIGGAILILTTSFNEK